MARRRTDPSRVEYMEMDIDTRLDKLRQEMFTSFDEAIQPVIATFIRAAYGKGVIDTLTNREEMEQFVKGHGYKLP